MVTATAPVWDNVSSGRTGVSPVTCSGVTTRVAKHSHRGPVPRGISQPTPILPLQPAPGVTQGIASHTTHTARSVARRFSRGHKTATGSSAISAGNAPSIGDASPDNRVISYATRASSKHKHGSTTNQGGSISNQDRSTSHQSSAVPAAPSRDANPGLTVLSKLIGMPDTGCGTSATYRMKLSFDGGTSYAPYAPTPPAVKDTRLHAQQAKVEGLHVPYTSSTAHPRCTKPAATTDDYREMSGLNAIMSSFGDIGVRADGVPCNFSKKFCTERVGPTKIELMTCAMFSERHLCDGLCYKYT